jgi:hypothetical protein
MSSVIILGVGDINEAFTAAGVSIPAAPAIIDFPIKFLRVRLFMILQIKLD